MDFTVIIFLLIAKLIYLLLTLLLYLLLILLIYLLISEICHNNQRIYVNLRSLIGKSDRNSMPLHKCNLQILIKYLFDDNTIYDSFIDFGCGEGNVIIEIAKLKKYMKIIGIEISSISYKIALKKCIKYMILLKNGIFIIFLHEKDSSTCR